MGAADGCGGETVVSATNQKAPTTERPGFFHLTYRVRLSANIANRNAKCRSLSAVFKRNFARARSMKTLTHFLDTPKRSEFPLYSSPYPLVQQPVTRGGSTTLVDLP